MNKDKLKLVVKDFISVNHYLSYGTTKKNGKYMAMSYKTKEAKAFQKHFIDYVKDEAKKQNWITDLNPYQHYYVDAVFYFSRIDMDCNNYWKVAFDAITESGVIWCDDNMACERVIKVMYDPSNPRIEYTIYKTDFIGIFNTNDELCEFEDRCKTCSRHNNNCSILRKAKEGRVQEYITDNICLKYKQIKGGGK